MVLPKAQALDLAKSMADKGLSGSISMAEPVKGPPKDDSEGDSELESCISDLADAMVSGDKEHIVESLHHFVDCLKSEDESQDEEGPEAPPEEE